MSKFLLVLQFCLPLILHGENRPAFCEPVQDELLKGLAAPYSRRVAPDGSAYCEGLVPNPVALPPVRVVSVKQSQSQDFRFSPGQKATLEWCEDSNFRAPTHIKLRSVKSPLFALDAEHVGIFEWRTDLIARWQPQWKNVAALAIRQMEVEGQKQEILLPIREGPGYSDSFSFLVRAQSPIHLSTALIERVGAASEPIAVDVTSRPGPTKETWEVAIPFTRMAKGLFRVTLEEGVDQAGLTTEPVYLLNGGCSRQ